MSGTRPFARRVLINTFATGLSNVWSIGVTLVALPVMLAALGTEAFGLWVLIQTFSVFTGWGALVDLGVGTAGTRSIAGLASVGDREGCDRTATTVVVLSSVYTAVAAAVLALLAPVFLDDVFKVGAELRGDFVLATSLFAAQLLVDQLTRSAERVLEGLGRIDISRLLDSIRRTAAAVGGAVAAHLTGSLAVVGVVSLVVAVPVALGSVVVLLGHVRPRRFGRRDVVDLMGYAVRIGALRPLGTMHRMMDRIVVGVVLGPSAVTVVEIATQVQNGADAFLSASSYAVMPSSSWLDARGDVATKRRLLEVATKYSMLVTAPLVVGPAILAAPLLDVWVGADGAGAAGAVAVAMVYTGVTAPAQVSGEMLIGTGRAGVVFRGAGLALLANAAATLFLVPRIGAVGAFVGSLAGAPFLLFHVLRGATTEIGRSIGWFARRSIVPVLGPTAALAVVVAGVSVVVDPPLTLLLVAALSGGVAYAVTAWKFAVTGEEIRTIVSSLRSRGDDGAGPSVRPDPGSKNLVAGR